MSDVFSHAGMFIRSQKTKFGVGDGHVTNAAARHMHAYNIHYT